MTQSAYIRRDGVQVAPPRERFELVVRRHSTEAEAPVDRRPADCRAVSPSFEELLELLGQFSALGYSLVRLVRVT